MAVRKEVGQTGIQQLLKAEQEAQQIVADARKEKTLLLRRAKEEADKEAADYRASREKQFSEYSALHAGDTDSVASRLEEQTKAQIAKIHSDVAQNKAAVVDMLISSVTTV